jgi:anti-sigma factor RsiW
MAEIYAVRAGVRETAGEEIFKVAGTGFGAISGFGVSEVTGEWAVQTLGWTGWQRCGLKASIRGLFALMFYGLSIWIGGLLGWMFLAASAGAFGGIYLDLMEAFYPAGLRGIAERLAVRGAATTRAAKEIAAKEIAIRVEHGGKGKREVKKEVAPEVKKEVAPSVWS